MEAEGARGRGALAVLQEKIHLQAEPVDLGRSPRVWRIVRRPAYGPLDSSSGRNEICRGTACRRYLGRSSAHLCPSAGSHWCIINARAPIVWPRKLHVTRTNVLSRVISREYTRHAVARIFLKIFYTVTDIMVDRLTYRFLRFLKLRTCGFPSWENC